MSASQMKRLRRVFDQYDKDKSGYLDQDEMWGLLQDCFQPTKAQMAVVIRRFDANGDGMLSRTEFLRYCSQLSDPDTGEHVFELTAATRQQLLATFDELDVDGNGQLSVDDHELSEAMRRTLPVNQTLLKRAISKFDKNRDSQVSFDEFVDALIELGGRLSTLWSNVEPMDMSFPTRGSRKAVRRADAKKAAKPEADRKLSREESIASVMGNFREELLSEQEERRQSVIAQGGGKQAAAANGPAAERAVCARACEKGECAVM